jgi:hypothetical protein
VTYDNHIDTLQGRADHDEYTGAEHQCRSDFLVQPQARLPQHGNRDKEKIAIGAYVCDERTPQDGSRDCGLADVPWVGVNLPVVVEGSAGEEDDKYDGDESCENEAYGYVDASLVELKASLSVLC